MSIKYICILAFISILKTPIESRVDIQNEKNILSLPSLRNHKKVNMKLPKEHKTAIHLYKHKKLGKYKPSKVAQNHYKQFVELPSSFMDPKLEKQHKEPSKVYPIYSDYHQNEKKYQNKSGSSTVGRKMPKNGVKNAKSSKKHPIRSKYSKGKKNRQEYEKESFKKHRHLLKPDRNVPKTLDTPSIYLKPPEIGERNFYNTHKRERSFRKPSNPETDYLKGKENSEEKKQPYVRDHEPIHQKQDEASDNNNNDDNNSSEESSQDVNNSADDGNRVDFHIHGQEGPDSYVFGYDTGEGDNRQFRWEQRHDNGTVTGQYGYYDPTGKFQKIFYRSDPFLGYQQTTLSEKHAVKNLIENEG